MDSTILIPQGGGVVGFDITLVHGCGVEFALDDNVRLGETLLDVPQFVTDVYGDVAGPFRLLAELLGLQVLVQKGGAVAHRLRRRKRARENLVIDLDEARGLLGDVRAGRRDRGNRMPPVQSLAARPGCFRGCTSAASRPLRGPPCDRLIPEDRAAVTIALTPGSDSALRVSIDRMRACA